MERKDFFKTIAAELGDVIANRVDKLYVEISEKPDIDPAQVVFLEEYTIWLADFQRFVKKRNDNPFDMELQKHLMVLSEQAEVRKPQLELFMKDKQFYDSFNNLTREITAVIS